MRVISLISQKGGAGKSTLAVNLATLAGQSGPAVLIDRDMPQGTTLKWWRRRQEIEPAPDMPELLDLKGTPLPQAVERMRAQAGDLFLDTRPSVGHPEAEAAQLSDLVLVPVRASINDVEAIADTLAMLRRLKKQALIIVNAAKNESRAVAARASLSRFPERACPHHLSDRAAWLDSAIDGRSVLEMQGASARAAEAELRKVWAWINGAGDE